jgi:hypothetical protein
MEPENPRKQIKTAEELAAMILEDLSKVDGCPERGVNVTAYGIPWKAMLVFGAAAGPVRNKAELQGFFEIITERLQRLPLFQIPRLGGRWHFALGVGQSEDPR